MQRILLLLALVCGLGVASAQTTILDFEEAATSTTFQYFGSTLDGSLTSVIANPDMTGINTSDSVLLFIKPAESQVWAGAFSNPDPSTLIDVTNGEQVCAKVWTDHVGNLALKLENSTTGGDNWITQQEITTANEWTEICFDPTENSIEAPMTAAVGNIYERVVLFFDFGNTFLEEQTYYFDDLVVNPATPVDVEVTFSVDMNEYSGDFTDVYVSGNFNGWSGTDNPLSDDDMDGVWETTLILSTGVYEYKFTLDDFAVQEQFDGTDECTVTTESGEFTNRQVVVTADTDLGTVCWESCYACGEGVMITFNVGSSVPVDPSGLYIAGGTGFGDPGDYPLTDDDMDGVYTITIERAMGFTSFYTFTNGACPDYSCKEMIGGQDCANPDSFNDRLLMPVTQDTVINTCFEECTTDTNCSPIMADNTVVFRVDMSLYENPFDTVYLSGSFDGWAGPALSNIMTDDDMDGIYEITRELDDGFYEYKFLVDSWDNAEQFEGGETCTVTDPSGQFTNRVVEITDDMTLEAVCFNFCVTCAMVNTDELEALGIAFRVQPNMTTTVAELSFGGQALPATAQLFVVDSYGRQLQRTQLAHQTQHTLHVNTFPAGVYWLVLEIDGLRSVQRIVKP